MKLTNTFAAIVLSVTSFDQAEADNMLGYTNMIPAKSFFSAESNTILYDIHTGELGGGGRYVAERARIDFAAGLICEWRATATLTFDDDGLVTVKNSRVHDYSCQPATETPIAWRSAAPVDMSTLMHTRSSVRQDPDNPDKIVEKFESITRSNGIVSRLQRVWDVGKSEVCLISSEGNVNRNFQYEPYMVIKWGCYESKTGYLQMLMDKFGIKGPI